MPGRTNSSGSRFSLTWSLDRLSVSRMRSSAAGRAGSGTHVPVAMGVHTAVSVSHFWSCEVRRLIWIVDVLPNEIAPYIDGQMDQAALAMQKALGRKTA